jgi:hypothetical protein
MWSHDSIEKIFRILMVKIPEARKTERGVYKYFLDLTLGTLELTQNHHNWSERLQIGRKRHPN